MILFFFYLLEVSISAVTVINEQVKKLPQPNCAQDFLALLGKLEKNQCVLINWSSGSN